MHACSADDLSKRYTSPESVILNKAKRNEESILLQKKEFWILPPKSRAQNDSDGKWGREESDK